jgi:hypothetical protein
VATALAGPRNAPRHARDWFVANTINAVGHMNYSSERIR